MILIPPGSGGWEMQCLFLHGMMGAGSEVWAGCGGCRARAVLGRKGNREIGYLGKAREGKKAAHAALGEPLLVGWLSVLGIQPALS